MVDTATQTDPITIVDPAVQSKTSSNNKTEELLKQKLQNNTTPKKSRTKTSIEEKKRRGWPEKCHEMIRKDWNKQQQKERQARSQSSPPTKDQTKLKSNQGSQRSVTTNRERKGSNDAT